VFDARKIVCSPCKVGLLKCNYKQSKITEMRVVLTHSNLNRSDVAD
jgi:hypothetical protein